MNIAILILLCLALVGVFWQQRQQAEMAQRFAIKLCRDHRLQYLELALDGRRLEKRLGRWGLRYDYRLYVSVRPEERYQAAFSLWKGKLIELDLPVVRE
ncbi:DUF3301 domain-containing protein [Gallaecimonas sp. GXIMD4217]|uniref:DUF3301 domain-containing protein n=1 Tax=Gallaecimonas sp. GXIMD4217 TaxID=3131927 RepID=UPI00311B0B9C